MKKVDVAFAELELATRTFQAAIAKFRSVYDPETVGLDYWSSGLDDTLAEIEEDIEETKGA